MSADRFSKEEPMVPDGDGEFDNDKDEDNEDEDEEEEGDCSESTLRRS